MNVATPHRVISHPLDSTALKVLAGTNRPLTGRQIARLAGEGSQQGIAKALGRLVEEGVVEREEAGSASLYMLNRDHLAAPAVEQLVDLRGRLLDRLRRLLAEWAPQPAHASLFGSTARGDGDTHSDIDIFLVRPGGVDAEDEAWRQQLARLADDILRWTGNHAGIVEFAAEDLPKLGRRRPPALDELEADAIVLHGPDLARIVGEHSL